MKPSLLVLDSSAGQLQDKSILSEINKLGPSTKTIVISEDITLMEKEFYKVHVKEVVPTGIHIGKRVKIAIDQVTFEILYGEDFSDDVLTIDSKYASTGVFITVMVFITMSFVTLLLMNL